MEEGFLRRLALFNALRSEEDTGIFPTYFVEKTNRFYSK